MTIVNRRSLAELTAATTLGANPLILVEIGGEPFSYDPNIFNKGIESYGDGTVTQANIDLMEADVGYVRVTSPLTVAADAEITTAFISDTPQGRLNPASGVTLSVHGPIVAGDWQIFGTDGSVVGGRDSGGTERGEENRVVKAVWFGLYVYSGLIDPGVDMQTYMARANDFLGNAREGVILVPNGNIHVKSSLALHRGVHVEGEGIRRTVFRVHGDGYAVYTSEGEIVRFSGANFELFTPTITTRNSSYLNFTHDECEIWDVRGSDCANPFILAGDQSHIRDAQWASSNTYGAGSAVVKMIGVGSTAKNITVPSSTSGQTEAMVNIGGGATGNVSGIIVEHTYSRNDAIPVLISAEGGDVRDVNISNIQNFDTSGGPAAMVKIATATSTAHDVSGVVISGWHCNAQTDDIVVIDQQSSGNVERVILNNGTGGNGSGSFFDITCDDGSVTECVMGSGLIASDRTAFTVSGTASASVTVLRKPQETDENGIIAGVFGIPEDTDDLVISNGEITLPSGGASALYRIDTESNDPSDFLTTINGGVAGQIIILKAENGARTVTQDDNAGNLRIAGDFEMNNTQDRIGLQYDGTNWFELFRSDNAA